MAISLGAIALNISLDFILIKGLGIAVWGLAAAFSFASFFQATLLFFLINKKIDDGAKFKAVLPIVKSIVSSLGAGAVMYFLLKIFDRSVWIKQLSFLGKIEGVRNIVFEKFVLDTRYTINLLILTVFVVLVGGVVYLGLSFLFRSKELAYFTGIIQRTIVGRKVGGIPEKETETVVPTPTDTNTT